MNRLEEPSTSKRNKTLEDDEIFDDSTFLANFDNVSFKQTNFAESNFIVNDPVITSALNVSALCCDEEISGYDKLTGRTWIYPTNYPVRDYQYNIIKAAILKNTLVSLPTGLGKTFIAAVIMYNFYRWYPLGKIVFTAPTRPLVAQQIDACYNIIAIPPNHTIEMTGHMPVNTRKAHWQSKRVFFATPQVIYNDLKSGICAADKIRCLVMDEAHRARGNYAYCQIVATLDEMGHKTYRMLALSATPGSKVDEVINVVKSLHIAHLELRTENCIDVAPYSHSRKINTVIVKLGPELSQLRQQYVEILDWYARRLKQFNILPQNLGNLSKGRVVMLYKEYQTKDRGSRHPQHNYIMKDFTILIALYHGLELLVKHGSRVFLNFFDEHPEKSWIQSDDRLTALLERLRDDLGVNPLSLDRSILPDGTIPEMPKDLCFGHPKFDKLKSIILDHFNSAKRNNQDTRAIIFCEYRESVNLVHCLLLQCRPLITPQMFVGQGASGKEGKTVVSQKQQLRVMRSFREGACNTLVATCVAEEGLDVGSVDLILCFDISTRSPVRLVQRCGRTGRERGGQVYILVTEGREHQTLLDCMRQRDGLNKKILQSTEVENNLYKSNPRMMPHGFTPQCQKMFITVANKDDTADTTDKKRKKGQKDLRSMLLNNRASSSGTSSSSKENGHSDLITEEEFKIMFPDGYRKRKQFRRVSNCWAMNKDSFKAQAMDTDQDKDLNLSSWLEWQRTLQKTVNIGHSKDSEFLAKILQKCDSKRLEPSQNLAVNTQEILLSHVVPVLQSPVKTTTKQAKKKQKVPVAKSPGKNYGDIRALFSTATKSTKSYTKLINDLGIQNDGSVPTRLINLLVDLNLNVEANIVKTCYVCQNICDCELLKRLRKSEVKPPLLMRFLEEPILPNIDLIDNIDVDSIIQCGKGAEASQDTFNYDVQNVTIITKSDKNNCSNNFDLEFDFSALDDVKSPEALNEVNAIEVNLSTENNFDIGDIEDIFANSSPEECIQKKIQTAKDTEKEIKKDDKPTKTQEALGFFGLDSIDDIFADYDDDLNDRSPKAQTLHGNSFTSSVEGDPLIQPVVKKFEKTITIESFNEPHMPISEYPVSPSLLSGKQKVIDIPTSPILCSQVQARKFQLSTKKKRPYCSTPNGSAKKKLTLPESDNNNVIIIDDDKHQKTISNSVADVTNKSMFTVTQIVQMINKTSNKTLNKSYVNTKNNSELFQNEDDGTKEDDERSTSPILLTQADKKRALNATSKNKSKLLNSNKTESLIILDSDSDSDNTLLYNVETEISEFNTNTIIQQGSNSNKNNDIQLFNMAEEIRKIDTNIDSQDTGQGSCKRKFDGDESLITASPYFNKKQKLDNPTAKPLTLQEKVLAAISSNKTKDKKKANDTHNEPKNNTNNQTTKNFSNNQMNFHLTVSQSNFFSQKENNDPSVENIKLCTVLDDDKKITRSPIDVLQKYRKESKIQTLRNKFDSIFKKSPKKCEESPKKINISEENDDFEIDDRLFSLKRDTSRCENKENTPVKKKISFYESDDDFIVNDENSSHSPNAHVIKANDIRSTTNHKVRKKKRKRNSFIEMEASLSSDGADSGDELTDESAGSIAEFICDDDADVTNHVDLLPIYLKSVRSPLKKNGFKIPELPNKYKKEDVFSQFVEEDAYEMDSFCVDSHIGLTQVNDVSELELAEIVLEKKRRSKKKAKRLSPSQQGNGDSPLVRRKNKNIKRQIHSDSDDSS